MLLIFTHHPSGGEKSRNRIATILSCFNFRKNRHWAQNKAKKKTSPQRNQMRSEIENDLNQVKSEVKKTETLISKNKYIYIKGYKCGHKYSTRTHVCPYVMFKHIISSYMYVWPHVMYTYMNVCYYQCVHTYWQAHTLFHRHQSDDHWNVSVDWRMYG